MEIFFVGSSVMSQPAMSTSLPPRLRISIQSISVAPSCVESVVSFAAITSLTTSGTPSTAEGRPVSGSVIASSTVNVIVVRLRMYPSAGRNVTSTSLPCGIM